MKLFQILLLKFGFNEKEKITKLTTQNLINNLKKYKKE